MRARNTIGENSPLGRATAGAVAGLSYVSVWNAEGDPSPVECKPALDHTWWLVAPPIQLKSDLSHPQRNSRETMIKTEKRGALFDDRRLPREQNSTKAERMAESMDRHRAKAAEVGGTNAWPQAGSRSDRPAGAPRRSLGSSQKGSCQIPEPRHRGAGCLAIHEGRDSTSNLKQSFEDEAWRS